MLHDRSPSPLGLSSTSHFTLHTSYPRLPGAEGVQHDRPLLAALPTPYFLLPTLASQVRKAYNTIVPSSQRFIGWWADVSAHVVPEKVQRLTLQLPPPAGWTVRKVR